MITWASLALLITAAPILAWRYGIRAERRRRAEAPAAPFHVPAQRPRWAEAPQQPMESVPGGRSE